MQSDFDFERDFPHFFSFFLSRFSLMVTMLESRQEKTSEREWVERLDWLTSVLPSTPSTGDDDFCDDDTMNEQTLREALLKENLIFRVPH